MQLARQPQILGQRGRNSAGAPSLLLLCGALAGCHLLASYESDEGSSATDKVSAADTGVGEPNTSQSDTHIDPSDAQASDGSGHADPSDGQASDDSGHTDASTITDAAARVLAELCSPLPPPEQQNGTFPALPAQAFANEWQQLEVPCIDPDGRVQPGLVPLVDSSNVGFADAAGTLNDAPQATLSWVNDRPAVIVRWDPNACHEQDPETGAAEWADAAWLIRGAKLNGAKRVLLDRSLTEADINLVYLDARGAIVSEVAGVEDTAMDTYPHLKATVCVAKRALLRVARGDTDDEDTDD